MAVPVCEAAMATMNVLCQTPLILNDGHEILAQLREREPIADIAASVGRKFGGRGMDDAIRDLARRWPPAHMEAVGRIVEWALEKLDTEERISIKWKGDADSPEVVTRFELRGSDLLIEFAHPPGAV